VADIRRLEQAGEEAVRFIKPHAVDVAGGIETNGSEDSEKIRQFITRAKGMDIS
jgi:phosphoribosylanthranilate isomerase